MCIFDAPLGKLQCSLVGEAVVCIFNASLGKLEYAFLMHIEFSYHGEVDFLVKLLYALLYMCTGGRGVNCYMHFFGMCILGKGNMYYKYILGKYIFAQSESLLLHITGDKFPHVWKQWSVFQTSSIWSAVKMKNVQSSFSAGTVKRPLHKFKLA